MSQESSKKWFVVHTYSGFEEKAKGALLDRVKQKGMEPLFGQVLIPQSEKETVTKTGKKKSTKHASFPGYIIVEMELSKETMALVKETPRITGFVGNSQNPKPLPDLEVLKLVSPEAAAQAQAATRVDAKFAKGESVKVTDGPFNQFDGIIDEVRPDKAKLRVLVKIFGRETPVELDYHQVQKLS
jgi:transcriptional antiterminator NusG